MTGTLDMPYLALSASEYFIFPMYVFICIEHSSCESNGNPLVA